MTTVRDIGDRLHEINQTIPGVNAFRYLEPNTIEPGNHPYIVPVDISESRNNRNTGFGNVLLTYQWQLLCGVGFIMKGVAGRSVQKTGEDIKDAVQQAYTPRTRLQLSDGGPGGTRTITYNG